MAQIDLSPESVNELIQKKQHLIERTAKKFWSKMFIKSGVVDYDDVLQQASLAFLDTLKYFSKSNKPFEALDPYLVMGMKSELLNWVTKLKRQFNYTFDDPTLIENIPETLQDLMPTFDDLDILVPLSTPAHEFLMCIFSPPAPLEQRIKEKVTSGKPYAKSILPVILDWMKMTYDDYNAIRDELREKCKYAPLMSA